MAIRNVVLEGDEILRKHCRDCLLYTSKTLYDMTSDDMLKEELKKLYNVCKYSDPVSSEKLVTLEEEISVTYKALYDYIQAKDFSNAQNACEALYHRILERNHACRLLK